MVIGSTTQTAGRVVWLGKGVDYMETWDLQKRLVAQRAAGKIPDTLLLMEHAPVYTAGPRSSEDHVLSELPAPLVHTDRGGQVTYHGPGQIVGYPIIDLAAKSLGPKAYVRALETALIQTIAFYGVPGHAEPGLTGVWTDQGKIGAIGVKISRGVSLHGFALNVNTDLSAYESIVPCGIPDRPVASIASVLCVEQDIEAIGRQVAGAVGLVLNIVWTDAPPTETG